MDNIFHPSWNEPVDVIAQAQGMVSVQADCSMDEALQMIVDRAVVNGCSMKEIAVATVDGTIRFGE